MNRTAKCPVCREQVSEPAEGASRAAFPFCSESCRDRDLGGWLHQQYRLGSRPLESDEIEGFTDHEVEDR